MQEDGMVEDPAERSEPGGASEELATFYSSQDQAMMQDCYSKIVEKLSVANPAMVLQVVGFKISQFYLWILCCCCFGVFFFGKNLPYGNSKDRMY